MKTRTGFVSNSSSSSFIVGVARVTNLGKLRSYLEQRNIKDVRICSVADIEAGKVYDVKSNGRRNIVVQSFQSEASIRREGVSSTDNLAVVNIINDEGDTGAFEYDEDSGINYDIDLDYFDKEQQAAFDLFNTKDAGVDVNTSDVSYGAGRNG